MSNNVPQNKFKDVVFLHTATSSDRKICWVFFTDKDWLTFQAVQLPADSLFFEGQTSVSANEWVFFQNEARTAFTNFITKRPADLPPISCP